MLLSAGSGKTYVLYVHYSRATGDGAYLQQSLGNGQQLIYWCFSGQIKEWRKRHIVVDIESVNQEIKVKGKKINLRCNIAKMSQNATPKITYTFMIKLKFKNIFFDPRVKLSVFVAHN